MNTFMELFGDRLTAVPYLYLLCGFALLLASLVGLAYGGWWPWVAFAGGAFLVTIAEDGSC